MCTQLSQKGTESESALLVIARTRKLLDSSLMILLFPTPLSHLLSALDLDLRLPFPIRVLPSHIAAPLISYTYRHRLLPCVLFCRSISRTVAIRMRKSSMCWSCARWNHQSHDS